MDHRRPAEVTVRTSYEQWVSEVARRAGRSDRHETERAIALTLDALGRRLRPIDARAVASALPSELGAVLLRNNCGEELDLADLRRQLGDQVPLPCLRAVCRMLAESLDEQARAQLRMQPLTRLFC